MSLLYRHKCLIALQLINSRGFWFQPGMWEDNRFSNLITRLWVYYTSWCLMDFSFNICELCMHREKYSKSFTVSSPDAASTCVFPARRWNSHQHIWVLSLQVATQYSLPDRIASFILSIKRRRKGPFIVEHLLWTRCSNRHLIDINPHSLSLFYRQENTPVWGPVSKRQGKIC